MNYSHERNALLAVRRPKAGSITREADPRIVVHGAASYNTYIVAGVKEGLRLAFRPLLYSGWATDADGVRLPRAPEQMYAGAKVHIEKDTPEGARARPKGAGDNVGRHAAGIFGLQGRMRDRGSYLTGLVQVPLGDADDFEYGGPEEMKKAIDAAEKLAGMIAAKLKQVGATPVASTREVQAFFAGYFSTNGLLTNGESLG